MLKPGDKVVYIGESSLEYGIKYGDIFTLITLFHYHCRLMGDIGLKLPNGFHSCFCERCNKNVSYKGKIWPVYAEFLRKASDEDCLNKEITEALTAPTPIRKFKINTEEEFHAMMEYGKTYLKQKLTIKFTDNFNFEE